jgi:hypothetical protein
MTPVMMIRDLLLSLGANVTALDWNTVNRNNIEPLEMFFRSLPSFLQEHARAILHDIHKLACTDGMNAINEAIELAHKEPIFLGECAKANCYARAMLLWSMDREIFQQALTIVQLTQLSWWRKKRHLPQVTPDFNETVKHKFEHALETLFVKKQSRGYVCTIDMLDMGNGVYYFFAYPDDYLKSAFAHDDTRTLVPRTFQHTFEVVFAYDSKRGTLEICGKVSNKVKLQLEEIFIETVLATTHHDDEQRNYDLSIFKNPNVILWTESSDQIQVSVQSLVFQDENGITHGLSVGRNADLMKKMDDADRLKITRSQEITEVKLRFVFLPKGNRPYCSVTFEIAIPSKNTIRHLDPTLVQIINKYLERWGIEHVKSLARAA